MSVCSCLGDTTETLKWNGLLGMKNVSADVAKVSLKWCFPPILISKILRVHLWSMSIPESIPELEGRRLQEGASAFHLKQETSLLW